MSEQSDVRMPSLEKERDEYRRLLDIARSHLAFAFNALDCTCEDGTCSVCEFWERYNKFQELLNKSSID